MAPQPGQGVPAGRAAGAGRLNLQPLDEAELAATIGEAAAKRTPLAVEGGGTLRGLGRAMQTAATLATARLTGVTLYEPAEMVLSARAGTPLAEVEAVLA